MTSDDRASWELGEGDRLVEGRTALRRLGGGSRYEAYLVWDELLLSMCVAKVLRPDQASEAKALKDLRREAEMLESLAHPVIVRGFDAVLDGPRPHLLIEHLEGPPLRRMIKRGGPAPLDQLLPLALHIASALHYMGEVGHVHLDVKPDNIIMGVPPRLIDLSIARTLDRAARSAGPLGTDAYMAPEQCGVPGWGEPIGAPSDVWGLGATLYHAASGRRPFPRESGAGQSADVTVPIPAAHGGARTAPHLPPKRPARPRCGHASHRPGLAAECGRGRSSPGAPGGGAAANGRDRTWSAGGMRLERWSS